MKNTNLNFRTSKELKEEFYKKCEGNMQTPSTIFRELIKEFNERGMDVYKKKGGM